MHICLRKRPLSRFEKGISLIALIITIIIIIILASIVIGAALGTPETAGKAKFLGSLSQIKESVSIKRAQNLMQTAANPTWDRNYGFTKVMIKKTAESTAEDGWVVNLENINIKNSEIGAGYTEVAENSEITLGTGAPDVYICDAAGEVYYAKGYKDGGNIIYAQSYIAESEEPVNWALNTVTGLSIALNNTFNDSASIKIYGKSEQETSDYTFYDYIEATGTQYINTNFNPNNNTRVVAEYASTDLTISNPIFGARNYTTYYLNSFTFWANLGNGPQRVDNNITSKSASTILANTKYKVDLNKNVAYLNDSLFWTFDASTFQCTKQLLLFAQYGLTASETVSVFAKAKLYSCKIYDNDTLIRNYIPAKRNSDNAFGMYDLQNNVFYTNAGTGTFGAGNIIALPTPDYPSQINSIDDFDLVSSGKNLIGNISNGFINSSGIYSASIYNAISDYIPVDNSEIYCFSAWYNETPIANKQYAEYDGDKVYLRRFNSGVSNPITFSPDARYIRIWSAVTTGQNAPNKLQLEVSNVATPYETFKGLTAVNFSYTLRCLSDEIKDYIEIDNVNKTAKLYRNIGVKIFNGTENWTKSSIAINGYYAMWPSITPAGKTYTQILCPKAKYTNDVNIYKNYYGYCYSDTSCAFSLDPQMVGNTAVDFKAWLEAQYNAGTPISVQYQLATPVVIDLDYEEVATYYPYTQIYTNAVIQPNLEVTYKMPES